MIQNIDYQVKKAYVTFWGEKQGRGKTRFQIGAPDFGYSMKSWKIQVSHIKMHLKNVYSVNFMEFPKSGVPIRNRVLDTFLI